MIKARGFHRDKEGNQKENEKKSKRLDVGSTSVPTTVGLDSQEKT